MAKNWGDYGRTFDTNAGNKTFAFTPRLGEVVVVVCGASGVASGLGVTDNNPDGLGTYTAIATALGTASVDSITLLVRNAKIGSAVSTTATTTGETASTGGGLWVGGLVNLAGVGAAAVRQSGVQNNGTTATAPTVTLGSSILAKNGVLAFWWTPASATTSLSPTTTWTNSANQGTYATPTVTNRPSYAEGNVTGTTVTYAAGLTGVHGMILAEFDMLPLPPKYEPQTPYLQAVRRAATFMRGLDGEVKGRIVRPRIWRPGIIVPELRFMADPT